MEGSTDRRALLRDAAELIDIVDLADAPRGVTTDLEGQAGTRVEPRPHGWTYAASIIRSAWS